MGQSIVAWVDTVQNLLSDQTGIDCSSDLAMAAGITPALAQFSIDQPRVKAVDITSAGRYVRLPSAVEGWTEGFSTIVSIEAPAGRTPPEVLFDSDWTMSRDPADPAAVRVLLPAGNAGQVCRFVFTTSWPAPTADAAVDQLGSVAFSAVTALAAAMVCSSLASESARDRQGALPTDFVDGSDRTRDLLDAARQWRTIYNTFIGLGVAGSDSASVSNRAMRSSSIGSASKRLAGSVQETFYG